MGSSNTVEEPVLQNSPRGELKPPLSFSGDEPSFIMHDDASSERIRLRSFKGHKAGR